MSVHTPDLVTCDYLFFGLQSVFLCSTLPVVVMM